MAMSGDIDAEAVRAEMARMIAAVEDAREPLRMYFANSDREYRVAKAAGWNVVRVRPIPEV